MTGESTSLLAPLKVNILFGHPVPICAERRLRLQRVSVFHLG